MCKEDVCDCITDDVARGCVTVIVPVGDLTSRDDVMVSCVCDYRLDVGGK
jgi:hypothetical protein